MRLGSTVLAVLVLLTAVGGRPRAELPAAIGKMRVPLATSAVRVSEAGPARYDRVSPTRKAPYLIYSGDNTEMDVHWQLDSTLGCTIEWGTDTSYGLGSAATSEYGADHQHVYTISGLTPGELYYYRVTAGDDVHTGSFYAALPEESTSLKFLAYGDTRSYPADHDAVAAGMLSTFASDSGYRTLVLGAGDLVSSGNYESIWDSEFFDPSYTNIQQLLRDVPCEWVMGNHEGTGVLFQKYFPYPFVAGRYYSFDYGPAHFTMIDQYTDYGPGSDQLAWIESDLAASDKPWKFICLHEPGWSAGGHSNETMVQVYLQPLCEQYGVPIVFGGHNHYYARAVVDGVNHVTTGGGGAPLYSPDPGYPYIVSTAEEHHYCKIDIEGDWLSFEAVTAAGAVLDSFDVQRTGVPVFISTDHYAAEIDYFGEAVYHSTLKNIGTVTDTFAMDIGHEIVPEGLGPYDWVAFYCDSDGICHFGPWDYVLEPGASETFDIHVLDSVGTVQGMALTRLTAVGATDSTSVAFATFVDLPSVMIVDDDGGAADEASLETAVADAGYAARTWDADALGRPGEAQLVSYRDVLWTTADGSATYIGSSDEADMAAYLDGGGNLMLASMDYLSSRSGPNAFTSGYLRVDSWTDDTSGFVVGGVDGDPISDGMSLSLIGGPFPPSRSDSVVPDTPAHTLFTAGTGIKGVRVEEGGHKVAFLSFPFEDIHTADADPDNQRTLVRRTLEWFSLPSGIDEPQQHRVALEQNVPNPFNPRTEIAFSVPEGAGTVTLTIHNISGQVVRTLVQRELPAGQALTVWDGLDDRGRRLASGIYFAHLSAAGESAFRKMTLLR